SDDDRPRVVEKAPIRLERPLSMLERTDRHTMRVGPQSPNLVECELRPGTENEVVVFDRSAVFERQRVSLRRDPRNRARDELDPLPRELRPELLGHRASVSPADRDPGVRRHEAEGLIGTDERDPMRFRQLAAQLEYGGCPGNAGAYDDNMAHDDPP